MINDELADLRTMERKWAALELEKFVRFNSCDGKGA